jgi:hypothetical protein
MERPLKWLRRRYELKGSTMRVHEVAGDFSLALTLAFHGIREKVVEFTIVDSDMRLVKETVLGELIGIYDVTPLENMHPKSQQTINYKLELWMGSDVVDELRKKEITPLSVFMNPRTIPCPDDKDKAREIDECLSVRTIVIGVKRTGDNTASLLAVELERIFKLKHISEVVVKSE